MQPPMVLSANMFLVASEVSNVRCKTSTWFSLNADTQSVRSTNIHLMPHASIYPRCQKHIHTLDATCKRLPKVSEAQTYTWCHMQAAAQGVRSTNIHLMPRAGSYPRCQKHKHTLDATCKQLPKVSEAQTYTWCHVQAATQGVNKERPTWCSLMETTQGVILADLGLVLSECSRPICHMPVSTCQPVKHQFFSSADYDVIVANNRHKLTIRSPQYSTF